MGNLPAYRRSDILRKTADLLKEKTDDFARIQVLEAGKPIRDTRGEVGRAVQVLHLQQMAQKRLKVNLFQWLQPKIPVEWIHGHIDNRILKTVEVEDVADAVIKFKNGCI